MTIDRIPNNYIDSLFKRPRMKYHFFKENGHFQGMELSHRLKKSAPIITSRSKKRLTRLQKNTALI